MLGVGCIGFGVPHLIAVSVIGGDHRSSPHLINGSQQGAEALVDHLTGLGCGFQASRMTDHVRVGKIDENKRILPREDGGFGFFANLGGAHFWLEIIGGYVLRTGRHRPVLPGEGIIAVVVEKERDVRIFFSLGAAELREALLADVVPQHIHHFGGLGKNDVGAETLFIFGQCRIVDVEFLAAIKAIELIVDERSGQFPWPVAPEIEEQHTVLVLNLADGMTRIVENLGGKDELVAVLGLAQRVGVVVLDGLGGGGCRPFDVPAGQAIVGQLNPIPAMVAIHRPEPPRDRSDPPDADFEALCRELVEKTGAAFWGRVPSIHEGVNQNALDSRLLGQLEKAVEMGEHGVDAGVGCEAHQVKGAGVFLDVREGCLERLVLGDGSGGKRFVDSNDFLIHDSSGSNVLVANLAIAHDPGGKSDVQSAGTDLSSRPVLGEGIGMRRGRQVDRIERVVIGVVIDSPSIPDHQHDRFYLHRTHRSKGGECGVAKESVKRLPTCFLGTWHGASQGGSSWAGFWGERATNQSLNHEIAEDRRSSPDFPCN